MIAWCRIAKTWPFSHKNASLKIYEKYNVALMALNISSITLCDNGLFAYINLCTFFSYTFKLINSVFKLRN